MLRQQKATIVENREFSRIASNWIKNLDSDEKCLGGFFDDGSTVWIAQERNLLIVDTRSGEKLASYEFGIDCFIDCARPCVVAGKFQALLIGVCSSSQNLVCVFDVMANRLLSATAVPQRVLSIAIIVNGNEKSISNENTILHAEFGKWNSLVAVGTVRGNVYLYDANLHERKAISNDSKPTIKTIYGSEDAFGDNDGFLEITDFLRHPENDLFQWPHGDGHNEYLEAASTAVTALHFVKEASFLAVGFSFGGVLLYSLDVLEDAYLSPFEPDAAPVLKFAVVEPDDDPRPTMYLWTLRDQRACDIQGIDIGNDRPSLEMYQLHFHSRESVAGMNYYKDLTLTGSRINWVPDSCLTLLDCATLHAWPESEKPALVDGQQNAIPSRLFMYFCWIHRDSGTLMGALFDINSWYHAQMPSQIYLSSEYRVCPYIAWHFLGDEKIESLYSPLICAPTPCSVVRFRQTPDTQFNYFACSYSLKIDVISADGIKRLQVPDVQTLVLDNVTENAIEALREPKDFVNSLQLARLAPLTPNMESTEEMRRQIWSAMLENDRFHYLFNCFEKLASSGDELLTEFIEWTWLQACSVKTRFDEYCATLFDGPTVGLSDGMERILRKESANLNLLLEAHTFCRSRIDFDSGNEVRLKSLDGRKMALRDTCLYTKIILWFIDVGVLPEKSGFYSRRILAEKHRNSLLSVGHDEKLFIDELAAELNECLEKAPVDGLPDVKYPLTTFRDVISVFLISGADIAVKHAFALYTLLDIEGADKIESVAKRYAKEILPGVDPMLSTFVSLVWNLDQGNNQSASSLLIDALLSWCERSAGLKNRFVDAVKVMIHRKSVPHSLDFLSPSSFDQTIVVPDRRKKPQYFTAGKPKASRSVFGSVRRANDSDLSSGFNRLSSTPAKVSPMKRAAYSDVSGGFSNSIAVLSTTKKARYNAPPLPSFSTGVKRKHLDESCNESTTADWTNLNEARSLLKVPRTNQRSMNVSCYGQPPVSILKKRNPDVENSVVMEKSIRFALPPGQLNLSDSTSILTNNHHDRTTPIEFENDSDESVSEGSVVVDEPLSIDSRSVEPPLLDKHIVDEAQLNASVPDVSHPNDELISDEPVLDEPASEDSVLDEPSALGERAPTDSFMDDSYSNEPQLTNESIVAEPKLDESQFTGPVADKPNLNESQLSESVADDPILGESQSTSPGEDEPVSEEAMSDESDSSNVNETYVMQPMPSSSTHLDASTFQSPTDSEVVFSYARNRWSMVELPTPTPVVPNPKVVVEEDEDDIEEIAVLDATDESEGEEDEDEDEDEDEEEEEEVLELESAAHVVQQQLDDSVIEIYDDESDEDAEQDEADGSVEQIDDEDEDGSESGSFDDK